MCVNRMAHATREWIDARIREAIALRRLVRLRYHGKSRTAEPHDYGVRSGSTRLLVYQRSADGEAPSALSTGWRDLVLDQIEDLAVLDEPFAGSRGGDHSRHVRWDTVFARVQ